MVTSTFYRFYNIWLNSTVFLGLTVSCNALALGFRLGRFSLERFSCCASHFIELVGNRCRLEYHNFCLTKCGSSGKIELLSPLGSPSPATHWHLVSVLGDFRLRGFPVVHLTSLSWLGTSAGWNTTISVSPNAVVRKRLSFSAHWAHQIGRASCRERVWLHV